MSRRLTALSAAMALVAVACTAGATTPTVDQEVIAPLPPQTNPQTTPTVTVFVNPEVELPEQLGLVVGSWPTDWTKATIDLEELLVGIPALDPRDRIPPLDDPVYESTTEASEWLDDREPGLLYRGQYTSYFFPIRILTRHEIVNTEIEGVPIAVTYCPLCNTGVVFDRAVDGDVLRFGVSGLLRNSDLVMWDSSTVSLWQQITGEAIVGEKAGTQLAFLPSSLVRWADFVDGFSNGLVLSRETGFGIQYGVNPYVDYSSRSQPYGFFQGELDPRFPALERVVGVNVGEEAKAYPFSIISDERIVNDVVSDVPIVVVWGAPDTADALDAGVIILSEGVGTGVAYLSTVEEQVLTFLPVDDLTFRDVETGSTWSILGRAVAGPLTGASLDTAIHRNEFWFAWTAFFGSSDVYEGA